MDKKVQEALNIMNEVRRNFKGTGVEHDVARQAMEVIIQACTPKPLKADEEKIKVPKKALPRDRKRKGKK